MNKGLVGAAKWGIGIGAILMLFAFFIVYILPVFSAEVDNVNLVSPGNDTWTNGNNDTINFTFNYTGENATASCELFIDSAGYEINSSVLNATDTIINANASISEGARYWNVTCTNSTSNTSATWILNVDRTNPTADLGTNPVDTYNTSNQSVIFDLKCSDGFAVDTLQLWGNWSGSWQANQTNSSPVNNTFWNITVDDIPVGQNHVWGVYCNDSAGNGNWSSNRTFTVDTTVPTISNIANSSITTSGAVITWNTSEVSNSTVYYSTNQSNLSSNVTNSSLVINHSITLTGLTNKTVYYYNVSSCDPANNCNTSGTYSFTTLCIETWGCGVWSVCSGGTQTRTCTDSNSCGTTVNRPALSQSCSTGGGGGDWTPPGQQPSVSHSWSRINPGVNISMSINKTGLDFKEINLQVKNRANQVSITVTTLAGQPATVIHNVTGKVYQYVEIDRTDNINDTNIERASIRFNVNKTWINDNNVNKSTIVLQRYTTIWNRLPTTLVSENANYIYYDAETPGFSVFAISGEEITQICTPNAKQCIGNVLQECNAEGIAWTTSEICEFGCDSATLSCRSEPSSVICTPGEKQCIGNVLQECNAEGIAWITETCPYGCENNACKEKPVTGVVDYSGTIIMIIVIILVLSLFIYYKKEELHKMFKKR